MENIIPKMKERSLELINKDEVRVRYAPSPTGRLHVGGVRTALFNYLFAKKFQGKFILRIEDTDQDRSSKENESEIFEALSWMGLIWDEGPIINSNQYAGDYGPYRQSKRGNIYKKYIEKLLLSGAAYYCFCSKEDILAERQYQIGRGEAPKYNKICEGISKEESSRRQNSGEKPVIRLRMPIKKIIFNDLIRGNIEVNSNTIGDIVIAKDINAPLYNLAVVIDDFEMRITHVIRGEDHITNTSKQIIIGEALNLPIPSFAHLPLVLGTDKSKLSKRHGDVSAIDYQKKGYLPEAMLNFLALLGWNPGTEKEIYSLLSLIDDFSIDKIQKAGAIFNIKKLENFNSYYIRQKNIRDLTQDCIPYLIKSGLIVKDNNQFKSIDSGESIDINFIERAIAAYQERLKILSEISDFIDFFFKDKIEFDREFLLWKDMTQLELKQSLDTVYDLLSNIKNEDWNRDNISKILLVKAEEMKNRGVLLWPLRVALTGKKASAGPFEVAEILGKKKTLKRIKDAKYDL